MDQGIWVRPGQNVVLRHAEIQVDDIIVAISNLLYFQIFIADGGGRVGTGRKGDQVMEPSILQIGNNENGRPKRLIFHIFTSPNSPNSQILWVSLTEISF